MALSEAQKERASYIRAVLAWHDITGRQLADLLGCTQQAASRKLGGERRFTDDELLMIADHFGLHPEMMLRPAPVADYLGKRAQADTGPKATVSPLKPRRGSGVASDPRRARPKKPWIASWGLAA